MCYTVRSGVRIPYSVKDLPTATGDLDKLVLDVENGLYPISGRDQNGANNKSKLDTILQVVFSVIIIFKYYFTDSKLWIFLHSRKN